MQHLTLGGESRYRLPLGKSRENAVAADLCRLQSSQSHHDTFAVLLRDGRLLCYSPEAANERARLQSIDRTGTDTRAELQDLIWECDLNQQCEDTTKFHDWFQLYNLDASTLVCISRSGAIVTTDTDTGESTLIGEFEYGLQAACWSADGEVLWLLTYGEPEDGVEQDSMILAMNNEFQVLTETIHPSHIQSSSRHDEFHVSMASKNDGSIVAVSSVDSNDKQRKVRYYQRETLELMAIGRMEDGGGKLVPNLQPTCLAWAGTSCSNLLATTLRKGKKTMVAFFEPNGLRHGDFLLREPSGCKVTYMTWNATSDILALCTESDDTTKVQMWTRCNYHWYLKYEFRYSCRVEQLKFDKDNAYRVYTILSDGTWREHTMKKHASLIAPTVQGKDHCIALVVDGSQLQVTPLHSATIPPPMYGSLVEFEAPIVSVTMLSNAQSSDMTGVVMTSEGRIYCLKHTKQALKCKVTSQTAVYEISGMVNVKDEIGSADVASLRETVLLRDSESSYRLVGVSQLVNGETTVEFLTDLHLAQDATEESKWTITDIRQRRLVDKVICVVPWTDSSESVLVQTSEGEFLEYDLSQGDLLPSSIDPLLEPCPWLVAIRDTTLLAGAAYMYRKSLMVGMSTRYRLYCHDLLLCDSITSFCLTSSHQYICYASTGSHSQLRFISLSELASFDPLAGSDENTLQTGYEPRNCEKGTRIVAVLPASPAVVLQMPRGNLENVYPRALVLRHVMVTIALEKQYKRAFVVMRKQKVDLNLFVDLDPESFLYNGGLNVFLEGITNVDHLNLFISCLQNWDCTLARYSIPSWLRRTLSLPQLEDKTFDFATKVNQVCAEVRKILLKANESVGSADGQGVHDGDSLLPILSTFAKENPPQLEKALEMIKENTLSQVKTVTKNPPLFSETAQSSIRYLAFLADYSLLFDTALGMHDFEIARAVARNSQMDPKVYLPLLKRYKELPVNYSKYEVDVKLKRYDSALRHLCRSNEMEESYTSADRPTDTTSSGLNNTFVHITKFIMDHSLYETALSLYTDVAKKSEILTLYGDYLTSQNQHKDALTVFLLCRPIDVDKAKKAAEASQDWRVLFSLYENDENNTPPEVMSMLAHDMTQKMSSHVIGKPNRRDLLVEASRVLIDYANDIPSAVDMLIQAECWNEAHRIGCHYKRDNLVGKCIESAVNYAYGCVSDLSDRLEQFCITNDRYKVVLVIRKETVSSGEAEDPTTLDNADNNSLFSAASHASAGSVASARSQSSVSSVGSLSSVISVRSSTSTSFGVVGQEETNKHKSKFNTFGPSKKKKKSKKQRQGKGRTKIIPGSEQELKGLIETMKSSCVDQLYTDTISETIIYLCRNEKEDVAKELYAAARETIEGIRKSQETRIEEERVAKLDRAKKEQQHGYGVHAAATNSYSLIEQEVDGIKCTELSGDLKCLYFLLK